MYAMLSLYLNIFKSYIANPLEWISGCKICKGSITSLVSKEDKRVMLKLAFFISQALFKTCTLMDSSKVLLTYILNSHEIQENCKKGFFHIIQ